MTKIFVDVNGDWALGIFLFVLQEFFYLYNKYDVRFMHVVLLWDAWLDIRAISIGLIIELCEYGWC